MTTYKKPQPLRRGDRVGIFVPSSPVKEPYRGNGLQKVRSLGYEPVEVPNILSQNDFVAKAPRDTLEDMRRFWDDDGIVALWAARGGYGANHLLPLLEDFKPTKPKIVIGSSDVSYLLWYLLDRMGMVVFYGPMAYSTLPDDRFEPENLRAVLSGDYPEGRGGEQAPDAGRVRAAGTVLVHGAVEGIVTGGCLTNLVSLIGTPFFPVLDQRVLLLEDVGERPYRLDRMFWQLEQAGAFGNIKGLLLGQFPGCFKDEGEKHFFLRRVRHMFEARGIPVITDLPFGHGTNIHTLPLGVTVHIDTSCYAGLMMDEKAVELAP